jgi:hypothetical protein
VSFCLHFSICFNLAREFHLVSPNRSAQSSRHTVRDENKLNHHRKRSEAAPNLDSACEKKKNHISAKATTKCEQLRNEK